MKIIMKLTKLASITGKKLLKMICTNDIHKRRTYKASSAAPLFNSFDVPGSYHGTKLDIFLRSDIHHRQRSVVVFDIPLFHSTVFFVLQIVVQSVCDVVIKLASKIEVV